MPGFTSTFSTQTSSTATKTNRGNTSFTQKLDRHDMGGRPSAKAGGQSSGIARPQAPNAPGAAAAAAAQAAGRASDSAAAVAKASAALSGGFAKPATPATPAKPATPATPAKPATPASPNKAGPANDFAANFFEKVNQAFITAGREPQANGQVLGGTTAPGAVIDPVAGDFTRNGGNVPIGQIGVELGQKYADGTQDVTLNFANTGSEGGTFLTPPFVAIQDGNFDIYNRGEASPVFLERLAEDGTTDDILAAFESSDAVGASGVVTGPNGAADGPLDPGETGSITLRIDPTKSQFLSFASMVIPSNDAFVSSPGDPRGIQLFDETGKLVRDTVEITGNNVLDAGTEVNTEQDAAFLNQTGPNTGIDENGVVRVHPGFIGSEGLPAIDTLFRKY